MIWSITIEFSSQNEQAAAELAKRIAAPHIETRAERRDTLASYNAWQQAQAAERQADELKGRL